jgi:hypothetical protein
LTLPGVIWVSGEDRVSPKSWPLAGHSSELFGAAWTAWENNSHVTAIAGDNFIDVFLSK